MISELLHTIGEVHVLRDPTRGGVSGTLNEIAQDAGVDILLDEDALPIPEAVRAASEMLRIRPALYSERRISSCDPAGKPCGTSVTPYERFRGGQASDRYRSYHQAKRRASPGQDEDIIR